MFRVAHSHRNRALGPDNDCVCVCVCVSNRYRNRALGSDNEDEILYNAIADDFDDPAAVVKRNIAHEYKLREWNQMDIGDK